MRFWCFPGVAPRHLRPSGDVNAQPRQWYLGYTLLHDVHQRNMIYAGLGAIVFSFYVIFDTQLIVGGKHNKFRLAALWSLWSW